MQIETHQHLQLSIIIKCMIIKMVSITLGLELVEPHLGLAASSFQLHLQLESGLPVGHCSSVFLVAFADVAAVAVALAAFVCY